MCCSFNIASAEEIFQGKMYSKLIEELQQYDKNNSVDSTVAPNSYTNGGEPNVQVEKNVLTQEWLRPCS